MTENIHFTERVSDIVAKNNWDLRKASFLGLALLNINNKLEPVCLVVLPNGYKYHRIDGSCCEGKGYPKYTALRTKDRNRVFTVGCLYATIKVEKDILYWEISSSGGVPECYKAKYAELKAAGKL